MVMEGLYKPSRSQSASQLEKKLALYGKVLEDLKDEKQPNQEYIRVIQEEIAAIKKGLGLPA